MQVSRRWNSVHGKSLAILAIVALLFSQWTGLGHQIAHGQELYASKIAASTQEYSSLGESGSEIGHSCLLFDALTLGAILHGNEYQAQLPTIVCPHLNSVASFSWLGPFIGHFSSRAPPSY